MNQSLQIQQIQGKYLLYRGTHSHSSKKTRLEICKTTLEKTLINEKSILPQGAQSTHHIRGKSCSQALVDATSSYCHHSVALNQSLTVESSFQKNFQYPKHPSHSAAMPIYKNNHD